LKIKRKLPQGDYEKLIEMSGKLREEDVTRKAQLKNIAKFMKQVLPEPPVQKFVRKTYPVNRRESFPTVAAEITPKKTKFEINDDVEFIDFGDLASPYLKPYPHNARFLDKQYGIRRDDDVWFMIGVSVLTVGYTSDISINGRHFERTRGLWELLTRKNVTRGFVTAVDLKR